MSPPAIGGAFPALDETASATPVPLALEDIAPAVAVPSAAEPAAGSDLLTGWPSPPMSPWRRGELATRLERCRLDFADGSSQAGMASRVEPSGTVDFLPEGERTAKVVPAATVRVVMLTRPLDLAAPPADTATLRRPYRLTFPAGEHLEGESAGALRRDEGLYLYPPAGEKAVARLFVPSAQIESFEWTDAPKAGLRLVPQDVVPPPAPPPADAPIATIPELLEALARHAASPIRKLGEVLLEAGIIDDKVLSVALSRQRKRKGTPLGEVLVDMGAVRPEQLKGVMAQKLGIPRVDARTFPADPEAQRLVPRVQCHRHLMVPLCLDGEGRLVVAMDNPLSAEAIEAIRFSCGRRAVPVLANATDIKAALGSRDLWAAHALIEPIATTAAAAPSPAADAIEFDLAGVTELTSRLALETPIETEDEPDTVRESDSTLVRLVNKIILDAVESGASDVHIEPGQGNRPTRIRMRRDGALADYTELPSKFRAALVSRVKIMANLDIAERRKPQDGKIDFSRFGPAAVELRVATIPVAGGHESVTLRVLAAARALPPDKLGLAPAVLARVRTLSERPHGLLLVVGPTGSGKTTTLHSLISGINTPERKIWTAEDPVEITQEGLSQVQVNARIGWTFADALRAFLRADPDVIMIGEMRDRETAETAVEASLTGHLVLSTLHTNSAPETVVRLLDLGLDPYQFGDALLGVLAQRLLRRVCARCSRKVDLGEEDVQRLAEEYAAGTDGPPPERIIAGWHERFATDGRLSAAKGRGCDACGGTGFRGRLGVHEFLEATPALRERVHHRASAAAIAAQAREDGMRTLRQDGIEKVLMGLTSAEQVRAVCG